MLGRKSNAIRAARADNSQHQKIKGDAIRVRVKEDKNTGDIYVEGGHLSEDEAAAILEDLENNQ